MSCKTCKTFAALIGIIILAANDGIPSYLLNSPSATFHLRLHADTGELRIFIAWHAWTDGTSSLAARKNMLMRAATVVQVLQDLLQLLVVAALILSFIASFIACFILLVIGALAASGDSVHRC